MSDWSQFPESTPEAQALPPPTARITVRPQAEQGPPPLEIRPQFQPLDARARDLAIRTIYGEAAQEPEEGQAAVAHVIRNRTQAGRYGGKDVPSVVLARNQFEPWQRPDARARMLALKPGTPEYERLGAMVDAVFGGQREDNTGGATHFYSPVAQRQLGRQPPSWGRGEPLVIGGHNFYAPEGRVTLAGQSAPGADIPQQAQPAQAATADDWSQFPEAKPQEPNIGVLDLPLARVNQGGAAAIGALGGATGQFSDELYGAARASGLPETVAGVPLGGLRIPVGWTRLGYEQYIKRQPGEAHRLYEEGTQHARNVATEANRQFPGTMLASEIGGAVVSPLSRVGGAAKAGASLARRALAAGRQGAAYGAISGAGRGETAGERATGAATEGATGAVLGPLATGVLSAAGLGARKLAGAVGRTTRRVVNPDAEAARQIVNAGRTDARAGAVGLTRQQLAQEPEAILADTGGGAATRRLTRAAYDVSPEAKAKLTTATDERFKTQSPRLSDWLRETFDYPDIGAKRDALTAASKVENNKNYVAAYRKGTGGIWDDDLATLWEAPVLRAAIDTAAKNAVNRMVGRGTGALQSKNGTPTLEMWDLVQRELRAKANVAYRAGDTELGGTIKAVRDKLNAKLDAVVPEFQTAREGAFKWIGADNALDAGINFAKMTGRDPNKLTEARRALAGLGASDRKLFEAGFVQKLIGDIEASGNNRNLVISKLFNSEFAKKQLALAVGPQRARELEARLHVERVMQGTKDALGGSQTSSNLAGQILGSATWGGGGVLGGYLSGLDPTPYNTGSAIAGIALRRGNTALNTRVLERVGEMLTSRDPAVVERAIKAIARNDKLLQAFRSIEGTTTSAAVGQAPRTGIPQRIETMATGRAEDNQPETPRPSH